MSEHFNGLTPAEQERLAILAEELSECGQAIGKILRHGYESYSPYDPSQTTNRARLEEELGHANYAVSMMVDGGDITVDSIDASANIKEQTIGVFLHHQCE